MKIYQVHGYGGEWEDSYDYIIGSYLSEKRAYEEMNEFIEEEEYLRELHEKCIHCPLFVHNEEFSKEDVGRYCDKYEPFDKSKHNIDNYDDDLCVNLNWNHEDSYYYIEEVEVIE